MWLDAQSSESSEVLLVVLQVPFWSSLTNDTFSIPLLWMLFYVLLYIPAGNVSLQVLLRQKVQGSLWEKKKKVPRKHQHVENSHDVHFKSLTPYPWEICCQALTPECLRHVGGHEFDLLLPGEPVVQHCAVTGACGQKKTQQKLLTRLRKCGHNLLE